MFFLDNVVLAVILTHVDAGVLSVVPFDQVIRLFGDGKKLYDDNNEDEGGANCERPGEVGGGAQYRCQNRSKNRTKSKGTRIDC